jgi:hypothetical protein
MISVRTRILIAVATVFSGILAGGVMDRVIVGGPAWYQLGAEAWAQYSRHADLGTGLIAYPLEGIGSTMLIIAAAVSNWSDRNTERAVTRALYCSAVFSVLGLLLTVKAAPIILGLATLQSGIAIQRAFDEFFLWGLYLRGFVDMLAFVALICALSASYGTARSLNHKSRRVPICWMIPHLAESSRHTIARQPLLRWRGRSAVVTSLQSPNPVLWHM